MKKVVLILFIVGYLCASPTIVNAQEKFKVVLDAGHGGSDPGNTGVKGSGYLEKDIALKVAKRVGAKLANDTSIKVLYTREDDTFIELHERGKFAHKAEADLFISIHCDSFDNTSVHGAGTFVLGLHENDRNFEIAKKENAVILLEDNYEQQYGGFDPNSPESVIGITLMQEDYLDQSLTLASMIQDRFVKDLKRKDRKVKQAGFLVLRNTFMPSILIEMGFLTNENEGAYLNSKKGQEQISEAIYKGIMNYKKAFDANFVIDPPKPKEKPAIVKKEEPRIYKDVTFKVQIASSARKVSTVPQNFKGLKEIERVKVGAHHKYYYGKTSDFNKIKQMQKLAKDKGYIGAFLVAFKNGKKVSVRSVLNSK